MYPVKRLLLLLPIVALLSSCSEDFKIDAPYKPVTVIYGLMNMGDTAHYIRIQKAFLDENKSALDLARVTDSNYYDPAVLTVLLKEFAMDGSLAAIEKLNRVDLAAEGYRKDTGAFLSAPNYAYKTIRMLVPGNIYRLVVSNSATGEVDSAETGIIDNTPSAGTQGFVVKQFYSSYILAFPAVQPDIRYALDVSAPDNGQVFEGIMRFHYINKSGSVMTPDSVDWHFDSKERTGGDRAVQLSTTQGAFYYFLRDAIGAAPAGTERLIGNVDLFVWAGSPDLANYQKINGAQGGITADQVKPLYTNIKGKNVLGLFTTRARRDKLNTPITEATVDSLKRNLIVLPLNITGRP